MDYAIKAMNLKWFKIFSEHGLPRKIKKKRIKNINIKANMGINNSNYL